MKPLISIIIPVFNSEHSLPDCINSVLDQTISDFELILVNDGSTDESLSICEGFGKKDNRIRVVSKPNGGCASARAMGVSIALGQWICFVDSDDTIPYNSLEILLNNASEESDIIVGFSFTTDGKTYKMPIEDWRRAIIKSSVILCTPWGKLFRNGVITEDNTTLLSPNKVASDMILNIRVSYSTSKAVTIINKQVYNYNKRGGSLSSSARWDFNRLIQLYASVIDAIPEEEREIMSIPLIENRLLHLKRIFIEHNYSRDRSASVRLFFSQLQADVEQNNYHLSFLQYLATYYPYSGITPVLYYASYKLTVAKEFIIRMTRRKN